MRHKVWFVRASGSSGGERSFPDKETAMLFFYNIGDCGQKWTDGEEAEFRNYEPVKDADGTTFQLLRDPYPEDEEV